jgi:hypothetical protein
MAFVLSQSPAYKWPVEIKIAADGGVHEKFTFDAEFKRLPSERVKEVLYPGEDAKSPTDEDFCREIVLGWSGIKDDKGADVPFSQDALEKLLKIHPAPAAISKAWIESISGAKEKN